MLDHVSNLSEPEYLSPAIWNRLRNFGVHPPSTKRSRHSKRVSSTPGAPERRLKHSNLFGRPLRDLPKVRVPLDEEETTFVSIPTFLPKIISFINDGIEKEGIFRLSGSEVRQRALRARLETSDSEWPPEDVSVFDAASVLKQWLRELPDPLIPDFYQEIMIRCCNLSPDEINQALTLSSCLLPENSATTVSYLFRFFHSITLRSDINKMDARNLSIVLAPSIFPVSGKKGGSLESAKNQLNFKTEIVERLISQASKICIVEGSLADEYAITLANMQLTFTSQSEDNLDEDCHGAGPSERRSRKKKKQKRRSGSLSRVFTAFKGIISRSTTPAASSMRDSAEAAATPDSFFHTPFNGANKRKANLPDDDVDAKEKKQIDSNHSSPKYSKTETPLTPKVRGRTFSVKRFKKKKSLSKVKSTDSETQLVNFSPLPTKMTLVSRTPGTPDVVASIKADKDMSEDESTEGVTYINNDDPCVERMSSDIKRINFKSSPPKRKIGVSRKRSTTEITRKKSLRLFQQQQKNLDDSTRSINQTLRRGQPNSLNTGLAKPSPIKVQEPGSKPRIKLSFREPAPKQRMSKTDSLADLKKDISSLIESSFGATSSEGSDKDSINSVKEIIRRMKDIEMSNHSPVTRSQLRRQSSAFEFIRPQPTTNEGVLTRRQSSAFEKENLELERNEASRASLRRKNSSVKDLIRKIESIKAPSLVIKAEETPEVIQPREAEEAVEEERWTDAAEFFKVTSNPTEDRQDGCKRSSIIRIRNEQKGKVSKSVETFTQPQNPPPRRLSARMGVSTTPSPFVTKRKPTGIRTTTTIPKRNPVKNKEISHPTRAFVSTATPSASTKQNNSDKKKKNPIPRKKGRRHLTIGYVGEPVGIRSPLKERSNVVITVQRSKSAQTPSASEMRKRNKKRKKQRQQSLNENAPVVQRSQSYKTPRSPAVPLALRDTMYDARTPRTDRVKRNLSDRVMTPTKGGLRNEAIPYIKSARAMTPAKALPSSRSQTPLKLGVHVHKLGYNTPVRKSPRLAKMY